MSDLSKYLLQGQMKDWAHINKTEEVENENYFQNEKYMFMR